MSCRSCGDDSPMALVYTDCLDEDGEPMSFSVCRSCDYGINEHTEGNCDCGA